MLFEFFQHDFLVRGLIAGLAIGVTAPAIGMFLVVRRLSLLADTLAHVALAGVALGILTGVNPVISAIGTSVLASLGIEQLRSRKLLYGESALAVFLSGGLAVAVVLTGVAKGFNTNFLSYLFGSVVTVTPFDVQIILILTAVVLFTLYLLYHTLFLTSLDEEVARSGGVPTERVNMLLMVMVAIIVSLSMRIVGVLLIGALMVVPVVTAMQFRQGFARTFGMAILFSVVSVLFGLGISYMADLPSGGAIVLTTLFFFTGAVWLNRT